MEYIYQNNPACLWWTSFRSQTCAHRKYKLSNYIILNQNSRILLHGNFITFSMSLELSYTLYTPFPHTSCQVILGGLILFTVTKPTYNYMTTWIYKSLFNICHMDSCGWRMRDLKRSAYNWDIIWKW